MICATCQSREERGFFYRRPGDQYAPTYGACSLTCIEYLARSKGKIPVNLAPIEAEAIMAASEAIGGHLENLGKTDFATFTEEEWLDFIAAVYQGVTGEVRARLATGEVPF